MAKNQALRAVQTAAAAHEKAETARERSMDRLRDAIRAADENGETRADIIRASGLARQTVYDALGGARAS